MINISTSTTRRAAALLLLALAPMSALAEINSSDLLDNVLARYSSASSAWGAIIQTHATRLFWTLATISLVWTFGMMVLRRADLGEFFAEFARFSIFTGFFWWLLSNGPGFAISIMDSLRQMGAEATGLGKTLGPSGVVDVGFQIFFRIVDASSLWRLADSIIGLFICILILLAFCLVGVNMLLLLISGWVLAYAGVFFLGFGGSRWTSDMAIGYFKTVLNIAAQLFAMVLIVGIGKSFVDQYATAMSKGISLKELGVMLAVSAIMLILVTKIPALIGGLAGGNTSALGSGFGVGTLVNAASMTAAAISTAGTAAVGAAAQAAGASQALMAAFSSTSSDMGSGGSTSTSMGAGSSASTFNRSSGSVDGAGSLASAMGDSPVATTGNLNQSASTNSGSGSSESSSIERRGESDATGEDTAASASNTDEAETPDASTATSSKPSGRSSTDARNSESDSSASKELPKHSRSAAAKIAQVIGATTSNLAQGAWDVAQAKLDDLKESAQDRVSRTAGGKIAAAINARNAAARDATESAGDNSLSAGSEPVDAEAEVAAFRDRDDKEDS